MKKIIPLYLLAVRLPRACIIIRASRKGRAGKSAQLSGNIEAHESLVGFKVPGRIVSCRRRGSAGGAGRTTARLDDAD